MVKKERLRGSDVQPRPLSVSRVSTASSMGSRRTCTPLPSISDVHKSDYSNKKAERGNNSIHIGQEIQQLAKLRGQPLLRTSLSCSGSDALRMPAVSGAGQQCGEKREEKKRRRTELLDIAEASEKIAGSANRVALHEAREHIQAGDKTSCRPGKLPKLRPKVGLENNIIDVINRHEASVKVRSKVKEISQGHMHAVSESFPAEHPNNAPEIIAKYEDKVGKAYRGMSHDEYAEFYEGQRSRSRCRSAASERSF